MTDEKNGEVESTVEIDEDLFADEEDPGAGDLVAEFYFVPGNAKEGDEVIPLRGWKYRAGSLTTATALSAQMTNLLTQICAKLEEMKRGGPTIAVPGPDSIQWKKDA